MHVMMYVIIESGLIMLDSCLVRSLLGCDDIVICVVVMFAGQLNVFFVMSSVLWYVMHETKDEYVNFANI